MSVCRTHLDDSVCHADGHRARRRGAHFQVQRAFTLVEMLVVVSIIVFLIAILLPALGSAKETANIAVCAARLNQVGQASSMYRVDWQHRSFGIVEYQNGAVVDVNDNLISLAKYCESLDAFTCPSTNNYLSDTNRLRVRPTGGNGNHTSFESYGHFDSGPRKTPMLCKGKESVVWLIFDQDNPDINHHLSYADNHGPAGGNVLHADLHIEWIFGDEWEPTRFAAQRAHQW